MDRELDDLIEDAERRAERVIGLVRLCVALALGLAFDFAVRGTAPPADAVVTGQLNLATATIVSYAVLGAVSFLLSAKAVYRRWFAYVFVTADVAFLVISLRLALLNTGFAPGLVTLMPSVWLVPLIITFGAMRYSVALQVYAGVALLAGLFALSLPHGRIAVGPDDAGPAISVMVADPPNIMRVAMIALACAVLVAAVVRTRRLLREAFVHDRSRRSLQQYLPSKVAGLIQTHGADELRAGHNRHVAIMFVDVRSFTALAEHLPPPAVGAFLARYRRELSAATETHGGIIDKFVGDGALIVFGADRELHPCETSAVACAKDILTRVADWSAERAEAGEPPVRVGIGIHSGQAFVGAVGDDTRMEFTVLGDTVNVASRVEELTKTFGVPLAATGPVLAACGGEAEGWTALPELNVRGRSEPVALFAFDPKPASHRPPAASPAVRKAGDL